MAFGNVGAFLSHAGGVIPANNEYSQVLQVNLHPWMGN